MAEAKGKLVAVAFGSDGGLSWPQVLAILSALVAIAIAVATLVSLYRGQREIQPIYGTGL